jgi:hypothetical protein
MNRRTNVLKTLSAEFQLHGVEFETRITGRSHIELSWQVPNKPRRSCCIPNTPRTGDWRNARADIRRLFRADGVTP